MDSQSTNIHDDIYFVEAIDALSLDYSIDQESVLVVSEEFLFMLVIIDKMIKLLHLLLR